MLNDREDSYDDGDIDSEDGESEGAEPLTQQEREHRLERQHVRLS
jgi:hypothetical protein